MALERFTQLSVKLVTRLEERMRLREYDYYLVVISCNHNLQLSKSGETLKYPHSGTLTRYLVVHSFHARTQALALE